MRERSLSEPFESEFVSESDLVPEQRSVYELILLQRLNHASSEVGVMRISVLDYSIYGIIGVPTKRKADDG